jgi:hypothetical protein
MSKEKVKKAKPVLNAETVKAPEAAEVTEVKKVKKAKPSIDGAVEPKAVKEKEKRQINVPPPPIALPFIGDTVNPLLTEPRGKRSMCVALARSTSDDTLLIEAVRISGVLQKAGIGREGLDTGSLSKNEHSGRGYAIRCGRKLQNDYDDAKVAPFMDFAKALIEVVKNKTYDKVKEAAAAKYEEWRKTPVEVKKKAKKGEKSKPSMESVAASNAAEEAPVPKKKKVLKEKREKPALE